MDVQKSYSAIQSLSEIDTYGSSFSSLLMKPKKTWVQAICPHSFQPVSVVSRQQ